MNKIIFPIAILIFALSSLNTFGQLAQKYMNLLPAFPENICGTSEDMVMKWNDQLLALKNEMTELQANEKQQMEQAQANAKPGMDMFKPSNAERIQKLGEEIQTIETNVNSILTDIISPFIEKRSNTELKYLEIMEALNQQKKEAVQQGKNLETITKKIHQVQLEKCEEMSLLRIDYLTSYKKRLEELIELGVRGNELSDEMAQMTYANYSFRTRYGLWLGFLVAYVDELLHLYDDLPVFETK